jgi:hypothetical protein
MNLPLLPANAGTQIEKRNCLPGWALSSSNARTSHAIWIPAFAGMNGF